MIPVKKMHFYQDTAVKNNQQIHISALYLDKQGKMKEISQDKAVVVESKASAFTRFMLCAVGEGSTTRGASPGSSLARA